MLKTPERTKVCSYSHDEVDRDWLLTYIVYVIHGHHGHTKIFDRFVYFTFESGNSSKSMPIDKYWIIIEE